MQLQSVAATNEIANFDSDRGGDPDRGSTRALVVTKDMVGMIMLFTSLHMKSQTVCAWCRARAVLLESHLLNLYEDHPYCSHIVYLQASCLGLD